MQINWRRDVSFLSKVGGAVLRWGNAAEVVATKLADNIWDQVICIDDLERKGAGLSIRDLLGYVSHLKEQRRCKVLVLTNSTELDNADSAQYREYHEKVFDRTLLFAPTPNDCCDIAKVDDALRDRVIALGISNIRVVRKIQELIEQVRPILTEFHPSVLEQAVNTLTLVGWMKYTKGAPPFEFLKRRMSVVVGRMGGTLAGDTMIKQDLDWAAMLDEYGYFRGEPDILDNALNDATINGYVDDALIRAAAKSLHRDASNAESAAKREAAWKMFHGSFKLNDDEVAATFVATHSENMQFMSAGTLDPVLVMLRTLGRNEEADKLIDLYRETHRGSQRAFDINVQRRHDEPLRDAKLIEMLQREHVTVAGVPDPISMLKQLAERGGEREDYEVAMQVTVKQLVDAFDQLEGDVLNKFVRACLQFENTSAHGLNVRLVAYRTKDALVEIGKRSTLNRMRVRKFNIDPDNPPKHEGDEPTS